MKTSSIILTIGMAVAIATSLTTLALAIGESKKSQEWLAPIVEQLNMTTIRVVKCTNPEGTLFVDRTKQTCSITFSEEPTEGDVRIVGDTLIVASPFRVEVALPEVTDAFDAKGEEIHIVRLEE